MHAGIVPGGFQFLHPDYSHAESRDDASYYAPSELTIGAYEGEAMNHFLIHTEVKIYFPGTLLTDGFISVAAYRSCPR